MESKLFTLKPNQPSIHIHTSHSALEPLPKKVAIVFSDAQREYFPTEQLYISEKEAEGRAIVTAEHLGNMGIEVMILAGNKDSQRRLLKYQPDFVINYVDSVYGKDYLSATMPATLELLQIPYIGTGMLGQAINSNKFLTKNLLVQYGITTPKYQLLNDIQDDVDEILDYPLISKLNEVHGSIEMDDSSVTQDERGLEKRCRYLMTTYNQPVILEEFIVGREITVIVLEGKNTKVYAAEKIFNKEPGKLSIVSFDDNWDDSKDTISYEKYELPPRIKEYIKLAFEVLKMSDYAKFDIRLDESGRHYIIDCNSNPSLGPKGMAAIGSILDLYDISFEEILRRLIQNTIAEHLHPDL